MRCDLHVHTRHSGMCTVPLLRRICRESYSDALAVYETLKQRGMDLVTITDHDSIDAAESLRKYPDFFLSEEVSVTTTSRTRLHLGVYHIRERDHTQIQRRRDDLPSLAAYLREQQIFFTINHVYSSLTGPRTEADFAFFARYFPGIEILNGQIPPFCNRAASELASRWRKAVIGGSDAHTLESLGRTYTEVPEARSKTEFLNSLVAGRAVVHGESGGYWKLTRAVCEIGLHMIREKPWTFALSSLAVVVPAAVLANCVREFWFVRKWAAPAGIHPQIAAGDVACLDEAEA